MVEVNSPIRTLRIRKGLKQEDLAKICHVSKGTISNWETGKTDIDFRSLTTLAEFFETTTDRLLGRKEQTKPWIPVLGDVAAGIPITAVEEVGDDWEQVEGSAEEHFALRIKGDSMEPRMKSGDVVIVHRQPIVENNEVAVVKIGMEEATVKEVKIDETGVWLVPFNPAYTPQFYSLKEVRSLPVTIIGKVIELRAKF